MRTTALWDPAPYDTFQLAIARPEKPPSFRCRQSQAQTDVSDTADAHRRRAIRPTFRQTVLPTRIPAARPQGRDRSAPDRPAAAFVPPPVAPPHLVWADDPRPPRPE